MHRLSRAGCRWVLLGVFLAPAALAQIAAEPAETEQQTPEAAATGESRGRLILPGLSEKRFHALEGSLTCEVVEVSLAPEPATVQVLINGLAIPAEQIVLTPHSIAFDYRFADGLNEMLVTALDIDGGLLAGDALVWAGDGSLIVDVVDAEFMPVDGAEVTVRLAASTIVQQTARTTAGAARFEHLPDEPLLAHAHHHSAGIATATVTGHAGSLLLQLEPRRR